MQKSYFGPCKIKERASGRQFQRFYYEKTLVGVEESPSIDALRQNEREGRKSNPWEYSNKNDGKREEVCGPIHVSPTGGKLEC